MPLKWGFIGCGNLSQALILGALQEKYLKSSNIYVSGRSVEKIAAFSKKTRINICIDNVELVQKCDVIFLVTKPQDIKKPLTEISPYLDRSKTVVSMAAGVSSKLLARYLNNAGTLARVMGNTPAMIQKGFFGIYVFKKPSVTTKGAANKRHSSRKKAKHKNFSQQAPTVRTIISFFNALGEVSLVNDDKQIDAVTAASASGVGFVFLFMEEFGRWLETKGFASSEARNICIETFLGTAELAKSQSGSSFSSLRQNVTSKKGTTLAGLEAMKRAKVQAGLKSGLEAACKRSADLSKSLLKSPK